MAVKDQEKLQALESQLVAAVGGPWLGLRPDLVLHPEAITADGRSWLLEDPVSGNSWTLGSEEHRFFSHLFAANSFADALRRYREQYRHLPAIEGVIAFLRELKQSGLAIRGAEEIQPTKQQRPPLLGALIYLRIPLLQPDAWLTASLPWLRWLWSPFMQGIWIACGLLGLVYALPQYEQYFASAGYLLTPQGAFWFAITLIALKIGHEFAHAYVAKAQGLFVRGMGVALIAGWPVLFTDTTEAWKLPNRRHRARIDAAGIGFELVVGGLALLIWSLLPDGLLRNIMFYLSGISIVSSAFVNLNPLMRFDGYYLLMDRWEIDNLQPRSAALLKHRFRQWLWNWQGPIPEVHPRAAAMRRYAALVMIYRVFVAVLIATAIFQLLHPVPGLLAFAAVLWMLLLNPLIMEAKYLHENRKLMGKKSRVLLTLTVFTALVAMLFIPVRGVETVPGHWLLQGHTVIKSPADAELAQPLPTVGTPIENGDLLVQLKSDGLLQKRQQKQLELQANQRQVASLGTTGAEGGYRQWLEAEGKRLSAELDTLTLQQEQLTVRAGKTGRIVAVNEILSAGDPVARQTELLQIADSAGVEIMALIHERDWGRIVDDGDFRNAEVRFPGMGLEPLEVTIRERRKYPVDLLPNDALYDVSGGPIPSRNIDGALRPKDSWYSLIYRLPGSASNTLPHGMPVELRIGSERRPLIQSWYESIARTLSREGVL